MLELSDSVRESLARHGNFGPDAAGLSFFLELALLEEAGGAPTVDFDTVKAARLDKLVADLTECGERPFTLPLRFVHDVVTAERLEEMWRARFKVDYVMIDEIRRGDLVVRWRLRGGGASRVSRDAAKPQSMPDLEGKDKLKPGGFVQKEIASGVGRIGLTITADGGSTCFALYKMAWLEPRARL